MDPASTRTYTTAPSRGDQRQRVATMIQVTMAASKSPIPVNTRFATFTPCWKKSVESRSGSPITAATVSLPRAESLVRAGVPATTIGVFMRIPPVRYYRRSEKANTLSYEHCTWRHFPGGRGCIPNFLGKAVLGMVDEEECVQS